MKENIIIFIAVAIIVGVGVWAWINFYDYKPKIENFDDCSKFGYQILNNYPRQCKTPDGKIFTEVKNPLEQLAGYLQVEDIVIGKGQEVKNGDILVVDYDGALKDGTKFDSSYDRGEPFEFTLGAGQVIPGWDFGLVGMKIGGKRKLIIDPLLAYGDQQKGPIPPNSILTFEIKLLKIK